MAFNLGIGVTTIAGGGLKGQQFRTQPVPNFRIALYGLSIRAPGGGALDTGYTFPISPRNLRKQYTAMSNYYDVGPNLDANGKPIDVHGVQRIIDEYGVSPVTYLIEGTTGWQYHQTDAFTETGFESIKTLQEVLLRYADLNQVQQQGNQDLYSLEFYDYFTNDFWQVEPIGPQEFRQDTNQPQLIYYNFRLVGVKALDAPVAGGVDAIAVALGQTALGVQAQLTTLLGNIVTNFANVTLGLF